MSCMPGTDVEACMLEVRAACESIYREMGQGHDEKVYQKALAIELQERRIHYSKEVTVELFYKNVWVGEGKADFLVSTTSGYPIVVELKAVDGCGEGYQKQLACYMNALDARAGMLINFWQPGNGGSGKSAKGKLASHCVTRASDGELSFAPEYIVCK